MDNWTYTPTIFIFILYVRFSQLAAAHVTSTIFYHQIKDQQEQISFFEDITAHLDDFPVSYSKYKILPQLLNVYQYGNAGPAVLPPLFKVSGGHLLV